MGHRNKRFGNNGGGSNLKQSVFPFLKFPIFANMPIQQKPLKYIDTAIFLFIWMVVFVSPLIVENNNGTINWERLQNNWIRISPFIVLSFLNHFILAPKLFFKRNKIWYFVGVTFVVFLFSFITIWINPDKPIQQMPPLAIEEEYSNKDDKGYQRPRRRIEDRGLPPHLRQRPIDKNQNNLPPGPPKHKPGAFPKMNAFFIAFLIIGFDTGLMTMFKWNESEQEKVKLQKDNVDSQLAFLRNQVSPHFFMNTLNNIHALIDIDTDEAKDSVIRLSKLMRHLLYESENENIPLDKEIDFIKNYIDLMRLRFTDKVKIEFHIPEQIANCFIPPLLFTSYLENAFKHGISYQEKCFVNVSISATDKILRFTIVNSIPKIMVSELASGIGLINSKKRLDLLYNNTYSLNITEESAKFTVDLTIPI